MAAFGAGCASSIVRVLIWETVAVADDAERVWLCQNVADGVWMTVLLRVSSSAVENVRDMLFVSDMVPSSVKLSSFVSESV